MKNMKIIVTMPAYDEERTIERVIEEIKEVMKIYNYQILVVDDGSTDRTAEIARKAGAKVISHKRNLGLVCTFRTEMKECLNLKADIIVHTDADGQYPSAYIPRLIEKINEGYDIVLGSRFGKGRYSGSLMKKVGNKLFARAFRRLLKIKITDTTTGFRAFTKEVAKMQITNSFTYTQEQLIRAGRSKMLITEVPITTNRTRKSRLFKNSFDYAIRAWINIFRIYRDYEPLKFFGRIGLSLIILGFVLGVFIIYNIITIGQAGGTPRVILSALLILVGIQIITFGFLADMIKR